MKKKKVELLAPAGSPEGFYGAIHAGADAVYLGGSRFGARAYADNFSQEELVNSIRYAHIFGRKVYLTVNTLMKEQELQEVNQYILPYYEAGLDGAIVQDIGVFMYLRAHFPEMELHASTQMAITGRHGAAMLQEMGASRIVLARELSLAEIKDIKENTEIEIETFIHGAMCYCYSGQCLFSSILGGRSGNRGRCAQPCRLPYSISVDGIISEGCYPLSLKDMCTVEHIPELIEAGIDSFKIEGRMKKPEYTAGVTAIYRKYIDRYYDCPDAVFSVEAEDLQVLSGLYIRSESHNGYYDKHNGAEMVTLSSPAYASNDEKQLEVIRNRHLESRLKRKIDIYGEFTIGKAAQVTFVSGEYAATIDGLSVQAANRQPITEQNIEKQLKKLGETALEAENVFITLDEGAFYPLKEINDLRRKAANALEEQIINGHSPYADPNRRNRMEVEEQRYLKVGENKNRRINIEEGQEWDTDIAEDKEENTVNKAVSLIAPLTIAVSTKVQVEALIQLTDSERELPFRRFYLDGNIFMTEKQHWIEMAVSVLEKRAQVFVTLPYVLRKRDEGYWKDILWVLSLPQVTGCMVRSLEGYALLRKAGYDGIIAADAGIYIWNREALRFWQGKLDSWCMPMELNGKEQRELLQNTCWNRRPFEKVVYGRIPMMVTANCVAKTLRQCNKNTRNKGILLIDRYHKEFPVVPQCNHCTNIVYNSVPLSLHADCRKWQDKGNVRLDFTIEKLDEVCQIVHYYATLQGGTNSGEGIPYAEYTTGHEKRGVE